jgi:hypothetical protein
MIARENHFTGAERALSAKTRLAEMQVAARFGRQRTFLIANFKNHQ